MLDETQWLEDHFRLQSREKKMNKLVCNFAFAFLTMAIACTFMQAQTLSAEEQKIASFIDVCWKPARRASRRRRAATAS